jgi:hypothetical protein
VWSSSVKKKGTTQVMYIVKLMVKGTTQLKSSML